MNQEQRLELDAQLVVLLKRATVERNETVGFQVAQKLFGTNPEWYACSELPAELEIRRAAHEVLDGFLRQVVLADDHAGVGWRPFMVPQNGHTMSPILATNARWLRLFGSDLPDQGLEALDLDALARLAFTAQAKALGRFLVVNDAALDIDYAALTAAVDPRLHSSLANWLAGVYLGSPDNLAAPECDARQRAASAAFVGAHRSDANALTGSPITSNLPVRLAYREGFDVKGLAAIINGNLNRRILEDESRAVPDPSEGRFAERLVRGGDVIFCPNWTEEHVAFRCLADAAEGLRTDATRLVMPQEAGNRREVSPAWADHSIAFELHADRPFRAELKAISAAIRDAQTDVLYFPEVTPNNASLLLALQRSARVQAAGYGYPVTSGSPHLDYFIGGADVELDGKAYVEQLLLVPGLGVSTTPPPVPERPRVRGHDEADVRVACIASPQKLNRPLLSAWEAILGDQPHASLDLYPALKRGQLPSVVPSFEACIKKARVDMHLTIPRMELLLGLQEADLYLDTFPYGGFNSLVEVFCCGIPVVTLEGDTARERFGAALIRRLGLPDFLITRTRDAFVATARRMVADAGLRREVRAQLGSREDVLAKLRDPAISTHYAAAIEYARQHGPRRGRPGPPVLVRADAAPVTITSPQLLDSLRSAA